MDEYYSWEEMYYELYPHLKKDTSFTDRDVIRIFHNNLSLFEQEKVLEYFCNLCAEDTPPPDDPRVPDMLPPAQPTLPGPIAPLIPFIPIIPALPSPPPQIPPAVLPAPDWYIPTFPFIVIEALPHDVLEYLKSILEVTECQANVIRLEQIIVGAAEDVHRKNSMNLYLQQQNSALQNEIVDLEKKLDWWIGETQRWQSALITFRDDVLYGDYEDVVIPEIIDEIDPPPETEEDFEWPDTQFPEEWEDFEDIDWEEGVPDLEPHEPPGETDPETDLNHQAALEAIYYLESVLPSSFFIFRYWYNDPVWGIWYMFEMDGEALELNGEEVVELAIWYGY